MVDVCPNCRKCGRYDGACPDCGSVSNVSAMAPPLCYVDGIPATHYAQVKHRFLCSGCASRLGLADGDMITTKEQ